jgi:GTP cyclohydrolase I
VHTLCPCSKEISENGAHNQRAVVEIYVRSKKMIWFEDLSEIAEKSASCPIYTLLKRPDEKFVTEMAYSNAKFVEDVTRDAALELEKDERIEWYKVQVTSFESIHNHDAFACVEKGWLHGADGDFA